MNRRNPARKQLIHVFLLFHPKSSVVSNVNSLIFKVYSVPQRQIRSIFIFGESSFIYIVYEINMAIDITAVNFLR